jgi:hypothetical protein
MAALRLALDVGGHRGEDALALHQGSRIGRGRSLRTVTIAPTHSPSPAQSAASAPATVPTPSGRAENEPEHQSDDRTVKERG